MDDTRNLVVINLDKDKSVYVKITSPLMTLHTSVCNAHLPMWHDCSVCRAVAFQPKGEWSRWIGHQNPIVVLSQV